jgi:hypothetical protein
MSHNAHSSFAKMHHRIANLTLKSSLKEFVIFHQPKTGGTFILKQVGATYILPHERNYHACLTNETDFSKTQLVCIVRDPLEYYISAITFWCLGYKDVSAISDQKLHELKTNYDNLINKNIPHGHIGYWISRGYTERNLIKILENWVGEDFINEHENKICLKHHTYDYRVFHIMKKLDIGYYTFSFLDHNCRKKINEINTPEECREELMYIRDNFFTINNSDLTEQIPILCERLNVACKLNIEKQMVSDHGTVESYDFSDELIAQIRHRDRFMFEIFGDIFNK